MVFGDPNKFAIVMELIPCWTVEGSYKNGLFHFIVDAKIFPTWLKVATLEVDILDLTDNNGLITTSDNEKLFYTDKRETFIELMNKMFPDYLNPDIEIPDDFNEDYSYRVSTFNLENDACFVFAVGFKEEIRILAAKTAYLYGDDIKGYKWQDYDKFNINVAEIILPKTEVRQIINDVKTYYDEKIK